MRSALRARLDRKDPSAKAEEDKLFSEALKKVDLENDAKGAEWLFEKAKKAKKEQERQRWKALDSKDYRLANRMYVADQDESAAEADKTNYDTYLEKRDKGDFEKEIAEGQRRAAQKKLAQYRATGHMPGPTSVEFLEQLKQEREQGVTKSEAEVKADVKKLAKILLKERHLRDENPPEGMADAMVTRQEAAEEADTEASRKMDEMVSQIDEAKARKYAIKKRVLDAENKAPFSREDDYIDRLQKDAEKKRAKVWVPPEKRAREKALYRKAAISRKLDDRRQPADWDARQKREDARLLGARNRN